MAESESAVLPLDDPPVITEFTAFLLKQINILQRFFWRQPLDTKMLTIVNVW